jgi:hypothetical protein
MRHRVAVVTVAFVAAMATAAFAQKTDFSGSWTLDADASQMGGGGGGGRGMMSGPLTVKQTGDTLTIERTFGDNKMTSTYKLDGTESTNSMMGRGGQSVEAKSIAKWDGSKLVINTKREMGGNVVETTETWSLANGMLTIESTGGRGPSKRVYKKTT